MGKSLTVRADDPLIVELIPAGGIGHGAPIRVLARQVVVRQANGTPISVVAEFGPDKCCAVSHAGDDDFDRMLRALHLDIMHVQVDTIKMPGPPPGARLIAGPQ